MNLNSVMINTIVTKKVWIFLIEEVKVEEVGRRWLEGVRTSGQRVGCHTTTIQTRPE